MLVWIIGCDVNCFLVPRLRAVGASADYDFTGCDLCGFQIPKASNRKGRKRSQRNEQLGNRSGDDLDLTPGTRRLMPAFRMALPQCTLPTARCWLWCWSSVVRIGFTRCCATASTARGFASVWAESQLD